MVSYIFKADNFTPLFYHETAEFQVFEVYGMNVFGLQIRSFIQGFQLLIYPILLLLQIFALVNFLPDQSPLILSLILFLLTFFTTYYFGKIIYNTSEYQVYRLMHSFQTPDQIDIFLKTDSTMIPPYHKVRIYHTTDLSDIRAIPVREGFGNYKQTIYKQIVFTSDEKNNILAMVNFSTDTERDEDIVALLQQPDVEITADHVMKNFEIPITDY